MLKELDIYCDAGANKNKFGIGLLARSKNIEVARISEIIPCEMEVSNINNAELYAIFKSLHFAFKNDIQETNITIYTDSLTALNATFGAKYKGINEDIFNSVNSVKKLLTELKDNKIFVTKIPSDYNHKFAHEIAQDAIIRDNVYEEVKPDLKSIINLDTTISKELLDIENQLRNTKKSIYSKKEELDRLQKEAQSLSDFIKLDNQRNIELSNVNNNLSSEVEILNQSLHIQNKNLNGLENNIHKQNIVISKLNDEIEYLNRILENTREENSIKIKILKEEFERLSIKAYLNSNNVSLIS